MLLCSFELIYLHPYYLYLLLLYRSLRVALTLHYLHTITGSFSAAQPRKRETPTVHDINKQKDYSFTLLVKKSSNPFISLAVFFWGEEIFRIQSHHRSK